MQVTFCCTDTKAQPWLDGLRAALPGAAVDLWSAGAASADYAVVWAPPQAFFDEQTRLKGIFNIGAGVDALLNSRLPGGVPVVRLDDAGMSVQMAEYVCHAVIRHFREFDAYEADVAEGKWSYRKPHRRGDFPIGVMGLGVLGERVSRALAQFDFPVMGWSRSEKTLAGVTCFSGAAGLHDFLAATRILVCLLPLTPDTENILRRDTLARLLPGAMLDVFRTEPLPAAHPFWRHPQITITPHTSARTLREESIAQIAGKIRALDRGASIASLAGVVDPKKGY